MTDKLTGAGGTSVKPQKIDRDALHRYLYRRADRMGRLKLNMKVLAADLELSYCNLTVVIAEMTTSGRLRRIGGPRNGLKTYAVTDPASWEKT